MDENNFIYISDEDFQSDPLENLEKFCSSPKDEEASYLHGISSSDDLPFVDSNLDHFDIPTLDSNELQYSELTIDDSNDVHSDSVLPDSNLDIDDFPDLDFDLIVRGHKYDDLPNVARKVIPADNPPHVSPSTLKPKSPTSNPLEPKQPLEKPQQPLSASREKTKKRYSDAEIKEMETSNPEALMRILEERIAEAEVRIKRQRATTSVSQLEQSIMRQVWSTVESQSSSICQEEKTNTGNILNYAQEMEMPNINPPILKGILNIDDSAPNDLSARAGTTQVGELLDDAEFQQRRKGKSIINHEGLIVNNALEMLPVNNGPTSFVPNNISAPKVDGQNTYWNMQLGIQRLQQQQRQQYSQALSFNSIGGCTQTPNANTLVQEQQQQQRQQHSQALSFNSIGGSTQTPNANPLVQEQQQQQRQQYSQALSFNSTGGSQMPNANPLMPEGNLINTDYLAAANPLNSTNIASQANTVDYSAARAHPSSWTTTSQVNIGAILPGAYPLNSTNIASQANTDNYSAAPAHPSSWTETSRVEVGAILPGAYALNSTNIASQANTDNYSAAPAHPSSWTETSRVEVGAILSGTVESQQNTTAGEPAKQFPYDWFLL